MLTCPRSSRAWATCLRSTIHPRNRAWAMINLQPEFDIRTTFRIQILIGHAGCGKSGIPRQYRLGCTRKGSLTSSRTRARTDGICIRSWPQAWMILYENHIGDRISSTAWATIALYAIYTRNSRRDPVTRGLPCCLKL
jgi:hypothetical protein